MFKRELCGSALSFRFHASSLQVEIFSFRGSTQCRKFLLDFNPDGGRLVVEQHMTWVIGLP